MCPTNQRSWQRFTISKTTIQLKLRIAKDLRKVINILIQIIWTDHLYSFIAQFDVENLYNLFAITLRGFEVKVEKNLSSFHFKKSLSDIRQKLNSDKYNMMILVVLAHGNAKRCFFTCDGKPFTVSRVMEEFSEKNCPDFAGQPKWLIFQVKTYYIFFLCKQFSKLCPSALSAFRGSGTPGPGEGGRD